MKNNLSNLKKYSEEEFNSLYGQEGFLVDQIVRLKISGFGIEAKLYDVIGVCDHDSHLLIAEGIDEKTGKTKFPVKVSMNRIKYWEPITNPSGRSPVNETEEILERMCKSELEIPTYIVRKESV